MPRSSGGAVSKGALLLGYKEILIDSVVNKQAVVNKTNRQHGNSTSQLRAVAVDLKIEVL